MKIRGHALCTAAITVLLAAGPTVGLAHAQADLDCSDFAFQEDAQAELNRNLNDPHRLDEDRGTDDGITCEVLPRRGTTGVTASQLPARGVNADVGGSTGPSVLEVAVGAGLAVSAFALAAGHTVRRRRRLSR
ncbi:hypothetical protein [Streptomyces dysideae]|uniref:Excalibur calcium-binding protein n=1 Tax=Streptomyces dysideae TaxID=909626 RepID=A0A101URM9_9ACTN|nr:hypothetical protein [Streptomyces dysideae]KUO15588.1 hypothetical protein AQJ91_40465 [Streptomyces dysideae]